MENFIQQLPKAEIHIHVEGALEPELMFKLAKRNNIILPHNSIDELKKKYDFKNLQEFLDLYYQALNVLRTEQDFYELAYTYFEQAKANNIVHAEVFFDAQSHTQRGISFETFMPGFLRASKDAKNKLGVNCYWILSFLRDLPEEHAFTTLAAAQPYIKNIHAIGLSSAELHNPPEKLTRVFAKARELDLKCVAHCGEEGPPEYIWSALNELKIQRVDHGVRAIEDPNLIEYLKQQQIPLTICPLSNIKLKVFKNLSEHSFDKLLKQGLLLTINSDDPAYFGGHINQNYLAIQNTFNYDENTIKTIAKNSFLASFLPENEKLSWCEKIDQL